MLGGERGGGRVLKLMVPRPREQTGRVGFRAGGGRSPSRAEQLSPETGKRGGLGEERQGITEVLTLGQAAPRRSVRLVWLLHEQSRAQQARDRENFLLCWYFSFPRPSVGLVIPSGPRHPQRPRSSRPPPNAPLWPKP